MIDSPILTEALLERPSTRQCDADLPRVWLNVNFPMLTNNKVVIVLAGVPNVLIHMAYVTVFLTVGLVGGAVRRLPAILSSRSQRDLAGIV